MPERWFKPCAAFTFGNFDGVIKRADSGKLAGCLSEFDCDADLWLHGASGKIPA